MCLFLKDRGENVADNKKAKGRREGGDDNNDDGLGDDDNDDSLGEDNGYHLDKNDDAEELPFRLDDGGYSSDRGRSRHSGAWKTGQRGSE